MADGATMEQEPQEIVEMNLESGGTYITSRINMRKRTLPDGAMMEQEPQETIDRYSENSGPYISSQINVRERILPMEP